MKALCARGFRAKPPPPVHRLKDKGTEKSFGARTSDHASRRGYLQCLVNLNDLVARGLTGLDSGQLETYYKTILNHSAPATVPLNATAKELKGILALQDREEPAPLSIEDNHVVPDIDSDDSASVSPVPLRLRPPLPKTIRPKAKARGKRPALRVQAGLASSGSSSSDSDSDSSSNSNRRPMPLRPVLIEGSQVYVERHLEPGEPGFYKRCIVYCSCTDHWTVQEKKCRKKRNVDVSLGKDSVKQALAFCGAWLRQCGEYRTRRDHIKSVPSGRSIAEYIDSGNVADWAVDIIEGM